MIQKKQYSEYIYFFKNYYLLQNKYFKKIIVTNITFVSKINGNFMSSKSILVKSYNISSHMLYARFGEP